MFNIEKVINFAEIDNTLMNDSKFVRYIDSKSELKAFIDAHSVIYEHDFVDKKSHFEALVEDIIAIASAPCPSSASFHSITSFSKNNSIHVYASGQPPISMIHDEGLPLQNSYSESHNSVDTKRQREDQDPPFVRINMDLSCTYEDREKPTFQRECEHLQEKIRFYIAQAKKFKKSESLDEVSAQQLTFRFRYLKDNCIEACKEMAKSQVTTTLFYAHAEAKKIFCNEIYAALSPYRPFNILTGKSTGNDPALIHDLAKRLLDECSKLKVQERTHFFLKYHVISTESSLCTQHALKFWDFFVDDIPSRSTSAQ